MILLLNRAMLDGYIQGLPCPAIVPWDGPVHIQGPLHNEGRSETEVLIAFGFCADGREGAGAA